MIIITINHLFDATSQFKTNFIMIAMAGGWESLINLQWQNILWSDKKHSIKTICQSISVVNKFWFSMLSVIMLSDKHAGLLHNLYITNP
jgi:hypothetical protein